MDKSLCTLVVYSFNCQILHYLELVPIKWNSSIYFFLDKLYNMVIIKPEAVLTGKSIEIKEKVSNVLQ